MTTTNNIGYGAYAAKTWDAGVGLCVHREGCHAAHARYHVPWADLRGEAAWGFFAAEDRDRKDREKAERQVGNGRQAAAEVAQAERALLQAGLGGGGAA